ncbi:hypothetical protein [Insolitispirillum peregrinum]|uniref:hypothetical protein n=1 Tax=Insolitispirillum peregrinum TaxID=80876 RepID=UPI00360A9B8E
MIAVTAVQQAGEDSDKYLNLGRFSPLSKPLKPFGSAAQTLFSTARDSKLWKKKGFAAGGFFIIG